MISSQARFLSVLFVFCLISFSGCSGGGGSSPVFPEANNSVSFDTPIESDASFSIISSEDWDRTSVRQVLHVFAYGGFASDDQISTWANMAPGAAIVEIITFDKTNPALSPSEEYDELDSLEVSLNKLSELWSSNSASNKQSSDSRSLFSKDKHKSPARTWLHAVTKRGLNPVRQRVGLFETNYHMAVNQDAGVNNRQIYRLYDDVMHYLQSKVFYQDVLAMSATSSAVAVQFNHKDNKFIDAKFEGNEDFGREFHQLYFGILGEEDPEYHELTSIRNTAKALTDVVIERIEEGGSTFWNPDVIFGTEFHYPSKLEILNKEIVGENAEEKLSELAQHSINHPESLANLPVIIVRHFADDNLDDEKIAEIRAIWAGMDNKDLLTFLRKYAVSTTFHNPTRIKYWSSISRNLILSNLITLKNEESYAAYYHPERYMRDEGVEIFYPIHNVFGHQTGLDALATGNIFKEAYNKSVDRYWFFTRNEDKDTGWKKNWNAKVPKNANGDSTVELIGEWLWNRLTADGLDQFGILERAHVYALLGSGRDLGSFVDEGAADLVYTEDQIKNNPIVNELYNDMALAIMNFNSDDEEKRLTANYRMGLAVAFISSTPYVFVQQGQ